MAVYEIPEQPIAQRVWTHDAETGNPVMWEQVPSRFGRDAVWMRGAADTVGVSWFELLTQHGPVYDVHPDLEGVDVVDAPWHVKDIDGSVVVNTLGFRLAKAENAELASLIVRAVNEYIDRRMPSTVDTARTVG